MKHAPTPAQTPPAPTAPTGSTPKALSAEEERRLNLKTEREARRQAEVGQTVRGGVIGDG